MSFDDSEPSALPFDILVGSARIVDGWVVYDTTEVRRIEVAGALAVRGTTVAVNPVAASAEIVGPKAGPVLVRGQLGA